MAPAITVATPTRNEVSVWLNRRRFVAAAVVHEDTLIHAIGELQRRFTFDADVEFLDGGTAGVELLRYLDRTELASGFANRFLFVAVKLSVDNPESKLKPGMPADVVDRAKEILANLEEGEFGEGGQPKIAKHEARKGKVNPDQLSLFGAE